MPLEFFTHYGIDKSEIGQSVTTRSSATSGLGNRGCIGHFPCCHLLTLSEQIFPCQYREDQWDSVPVRDDVITIVNIEWGKGCVDTIGKEFVQLVRISSINSAHSQ